MDHKTENSIRRAFRLLTGYGLHISTGNSHPDEDGVLLYIKSPEEYYAFLEGMDLETFRRSNKRHGIPQCGEITQSGQRCNNRSAGPDGKPLYGGFLEYDGLPCGIHIRMMRK